MDRTNNSRVRAVEISDSRSLSHFVTVYTKKPIPLWEELHDGHNPELFHREGRPFSQIGAHYHLLSDTPPTIESFGVFLSGMSDGLKETITQFLEGS